MRAGSTCLHTALPRRSQRAAVELSAVGVDPVEAVEARGVAVDEELAEDVAVTAARRGNSGLVGVEPAGDVVSRIRRFQRDCSDSRMGDDALNAINDAYGSPTRSTLFIAHPTLPRRLGISHQTP